MNVTVGPSSAAPLSFVVEAYPDCADELIQFRNRNRSTIRERVYFDWRHLGRPCRLKSVTVWALSENSRVGALTIFPHDFHVRDAEYPVGVLGDISVLPECRGLGVATAMFRVLPKVEALRLLRGCIVLPNDEAAGALKKADWEETGRIDRLILFVDFATRLRRFTRSDRLARVFAAPLNWALRTASSEGSLSLPGRFKGALVSDLDERFDDLWHRVEKRDRIVALRDRRYLSWRFALHPVEKYFTFALTESDRLCGYIVYRRLDEVCYIEDIFGLDAGSYSAYLLGLFVRHVRDLGSIAMISARANRSFMRLPWRRFGFIRRPDYMSVLASREFTDLSGVGREHAESWHLTAGDKDV